MKYTLALSLLLCAIAGFPAPCQTPQMDVETEIAVIKTEIKNLNKKIDDKFQVVDAKFVSLEKKFDEKFVSLEKKFDEKFASLEKKFDGKFVNFEKNFDRLNNIIIACIGIPLAILAIGATVWGILASRRSRKDQTLEKQIETLTQEIEALKRQQIVRP